MIKYIPNISIKDVIEAQNRNDLVGKIVEQLIYKMGWNSMQDKIEFFENCGIGLDDTLVDNLILIGEKRNIIVHNQGVVNDVLPCHIRNFIHHNYSTFISR